MTVFKNILSSVGSVITGNLSSIPSAETPGRIFIPNDVHGDFQLVDNGSSWDSYLGGKKCSKPPALSSMSAINVDSFTTVTEDACGILYTQWGKSAPAQWISGYVTAVPSAPYQFIVGIQPIKLIQSNYCTIGLTVTDGNSSPKMVIFALIFRSAAVSGLNWQNPYFNSPTSWNADNTIIGNTVHMFLPYFYMRIKDDNTNRLFDVSRDGVIWENLISVPRTTFLTPTYIGFVGHQAGPLNVGSTVEVVKYRLFHWSLAQI
jgi:hypothetical protein